MACPTVTLSQPEIEENLKTLPRWRFTENALERSHTGKTYLEALEILNAVARLSEKADHHPDLRLNWKTLIVRYWTHRAHGVTSLDFELAHSVENLFET